MKAAATLALLSTLTSACAMTRQSKAVVIGSGAVVSFLGMSMIASSGVDADNNGVNENPLDDDLDSAIGGSALFLAGVAILAAGIASPELHVEAAPAVPAHARPASVTWTPEVQPFLYAESDAPGASMPPVQPFHAALPEVATTDVVLRMAQQARAAVEHGHCDAAWSTWDAMNQRDARYASALAAGPVFSVCPRATAINAAR